MHLKTELLPHQTAAVEKLAPIRVGGLFMDMGTGKSRTTMELVARRHAAGNVSNVVWFAPVSLKETVRQEIAKHTEGESTYVFDHKTSEDRLPKAFWNVVGIESMSKCERVLYATDKIVDKNTFVIVDESSFIKGHQAARTQWITRLGERARYRYILTGTPLSQGVVDLYSQMRFLSPQILGFKSFYSFERRHLEYSEKYPGLIRRTLHTDEIAAKIAPYVYQVRKDECLTLPEKLYSTRYCSMTLAQREFYEAVKEQFAVEVLGEDDWTSRMAIFRLFTRLQQIVSGFCRIRDPKTGLMQQVEFAHNRLELLTETLGQIPPGEKVIIWAKYRREVEEICAALPGAVAFYGDLNEAERNQNVESFRRDAQYFVATQDTGGHGLTLNEAAYSVFYSNQFKFAHRQQAEDRNHRIGQGRKVTYIDLLCARSIDERIAAAQARKGSVVEAFRDEVHKVRGKNRALEALVKAL